MMYPNKNKKKLLCTAVATYFASLGITASAEDTSGLDQLLEEVVVTAQNREQSMQDVPISMNVMSAAMLEKAGVNDMNSLTRVAPDLAIVNDSNNTRISIRGIGTQSNDEAQDQALTVNIDGEYINRMRVFNASMFDIDRIEVLRGPQGTLYGRNATAGAVNIHTKKPSLDAVKGNVSVGAGNYDQKNINAAINLPVSDTFAVRIAAMSTEHEGYVTHPNLGRRSGDDDVVAGRIGLLFQPSEQLSIYFAAERVEVDRVPTIFSSTNLNQSPNQADELGTGGCSGDGWTEITVLDGNTLCAPQNTHFMDKIDRANYDGTLAIIDSGSMENDSTAYRGEINYEFNDMTLTYRMGYRDSDLLIDNPLPPAYVFYRFAGIETLSQELRLTGGSDDGIFWQTGVFFFNEEQISGGGLYNPFINFLPGQNGSYPNVFYRNPVESKSKAIFGQIDYPLTNNVTAVVGARYTSDKKNGTYIDLGFVPNFADDPANFPALSTADPSIYNSVNADNEEVTWSVGLNWNPSNDTMVYGKISKGYKAGGFDSYGSYDPEILLAYEAGSKSTFGKFKLNTSAFFYDYSDLQSAVLVDTSRGGQTFNAGEATLYGFEVELETWLTDHDRLGLTANYLHSEYDEFFTVIPVQCLGGCSVTAVGDLDGTSGGDIVSPNLAGNETPNAPTWLFGLTYDHMWTLTDGSIITASLQSRYKDEYYNSIYNYADGKQDAYVQTDASIQFESGEGDWSVLVYVRNIEDERPITYAAYTAAGPDDIFVSSYGAPRTFGAKATYNF